MLLYSFALAVGLVLSAPWWVVRMMRTQRYREGLRERLGRVSAGLRAFVAGKKVVWVHAVSVGEVLAATRLVAELQAALETHVSEARHGAPEWVVVVSTTTRTGQALARERFGTERVFYYPLDFAFAVRAFLRVLRPEILVLMESEVWPRMLHEARRMSVPVAVVNARVSDRSFARGMRVRAVWGRVLLGVSLWLAQSEEDARRLVAMGASAESVRAIGNLKYDVRAPKVSRVVRWIKEIAGEKLIFVAGSTVEIGSAAGISAEEYLIVNAWKRSAEQGQKCLLVLAPRHPERFEKVQTLAAHYVVARASAWNYRWNNQTREETEQRPSSLVLPGTKGKVEIVLLDTIGDLASVYEVADVAFVGGSLVPKGGHNPLEPAQFAVPTIMGPSFENFRGVVAAMQEAGGIWIAESAESLENALFFLLEDRKLAKAMGERGRRVFEEQQGATGRAVEALVAMVSR
jgi:3-deoxy-D-manno-octulosonic-acid transferase